MAILYYHASLPIIQCDIYLVTRLCAGSSMTEPRYFSMSDPVYFYDASAGGKTDESPASNMDFAESAAAAEDEAVAPSKVGMRLQGTCF